MNKVACFFAAIGEGKEIEVAIQESRVNELTTLEILKEIAVMWVNLTKND